MDLTPFEDAGLFDRNTPGVDDTIEMLEYLHGLGVPVPDLITAMHGGHVHAAASDPLLREGDLTVNDVAARVGTTAEHVIEVYRLLGIDVPDPTERRFREEEIDSMRIMHEATGAFEGGEADEILRAASAALTNVAEAVVSVFVGGVEQRLIDEQQLGDLALAKMVQEMTETGIEFGQAMGNLFRHHLWAAITRQRASMLDSPDRFTQMIAVGFVDLVGFTPRSAEMSAAELVSFIRDFESRSYDIASRAGGRLVKTIGDEVMVSALTADAGASIVLDLIDEFRTGGTAPRGGMAFGGVIGRRGDFFGPVVNLASRLVDEAVPGEVLTDVSSAAHMTNCRCEPAGRRMLKGFAEPVAVLSVGR